MTAVTAMKALANVPVISVIMVSASNQPEINSNITEEGQGTTPEAVIAITAVTLVESRITIVETQTYLVSHGRSLASTID